MSADTPPPSRISALAVWSALALLALSSIIAVARGPTPMDFDVYWTAARAFVGGSDPYAAAELPFVYPPAALWLFAPLGALGSGAASALWATLCWAAVVAIGIGFARLVQLDVRPEIAVGIALLHFPIYRALEPMNVALVLLVALLGCALGRGERPVLSEVAIGFVAGFVLMLKPYWLSIAGPALLLRRRWAALGGLVAGAATLSAASLAQPDLFSAFLDRAQWVLATQKTVDLWKLSPGLGAVASLLWLLGLAWVVRARHPDGWLYAFTAVLVWTRANAYGYVVVLPLVWWLIARLGKRGAAAAVVFSTPLGLLTVLRIENGAPILELGWGPLTAATNWGYWLVTLAMTIYLIGVLSGRFRQQST